VTCDCFFSQGVGNAKGSNSWLLLGSPWAWSNPIEPYRWGFVEDGGGSLYTEFKPFRGQNKGMGGKERKNSQRSTTRFLCASQSGMIVSYPSSRLYSGWTTVGRALSVAESP
jgi:hypothetical protein